LWGTRAIIISASGLAKKAAVDTSRAYTNGGGRKKKCGCSKPAIAVDRVCAKM